MSAARLFLSTLVGALLAVNIASAVTFESAEKQAGLLELYTSEGCSSCPPADRYLSTLKDKEGLWSEFIPLAFHVDYWDYIGWRDRFASPAHTSRQRQHAREQSMRTIYTPGFIYNGLEWKQWWARQYFDFPETGAAGKLTVDVGDRTASVRFEPINPPAGDLEVDIAVLGFDLETPVAAGENTGVVLKHDFVVLGSRRGKLVHSDGRYVGTIALPEKSEDAPKYAVALWVSQVGSQRPLQAVGGWLE